jgi:hypothetical protein
MRAPLTMPTALLCALALLAACDSGDDQPGSADAGEAAPAITVTIPPERLTPFCETVSELDTALAEVSAGTDQRTTILAAYTELVEQGEVPAALAPDFEAVIADLEAPPAATTSSTSSASTVTTSSTSTSTSTTTQAPHDSSSSASAPGVTGSGPTSTDFWDEGYGPEDTPAGRIAAYIDFACQDIANNPGPPDTEPGDIVGTTIT